MFFEYFIENELHDVTECLNSLNLYESAVRLPVPSYTTSNGKLYLIPTIFDHSQPNTVKSPPLIIYDCETATFIPHDTYHYIPIEAFEGDYGGYSCLTATDTHLYVIGGRPKTLPDPNNFGWQTNVCFD